jgi:hypothetical protein
MRTIPWVSVFGKYKRLASIGVGICVLCSIFGAWAGENERGLQRVAAVSTPSAKGSPSGDLRQWIKSQKKRRCHIDKQAGKRRCQICTVLGGGRLRCPVSRRPGGLEIFSPSGGYCDPGCYYTGGEDCNCPDGGGDGDGDGN